MGDDAVNKTVSQGDAKSAEEMAAMLQGALPEASEPEQPKEEEEDPSLFLDGQNVPALFAAHMPLKEVGFHIGDCEKESVVKIKPMGADAASRYMDVMLRVIMQNQKEGTPMEFRYAELDLMILQESVVSMDLWYTRSGRMEQYQFPRGIREREQFFKDLEQGLRQKLVAECRKANGFNPLAGI